MAINPKFTSFIGIAICAVAINCGGDNGPVNAIDEGGLDASVAPVDTGANAADATGANTADADEPGAISDAMISVSASDAMMMTSPLCMGVACGNGTCSAASGQPLCECAPHFTGTTCDTCARGYTGRDCGSCVNGYVDDGDGGCVVDPCAALGCLNGSTCEIDRAGPHCACPPQFVGPMCERCAAGHTGAGCTQCLSGFQRQNGVCVADICFNVECGSGNCKDVSGMATCVCNTGYKGAACDQCDVGYTLSRGLCQNTLPTAAVAALVWFDAAATGTMDILANNDVRVWRNRKNLKQTFNGYYVGDGHLPRYSPEIRGLVFDADVMVSFHDLPAQKQHYTIFTVARWNKNAGMQVLMNSRETVNGYVGLGLSVSGTSARFVHRAPPAPSGADDLIADLFGAAGPAHLIIAKRVPLGLGTAHAVSNGTDAKLVVATSLGTVQPMYSVLGMAQPLLSAPQALNGVVHEIIMFAGALTVPEEKRVVDYLKVKWAL